jgi:hypothetical protein
MQAVSIVMKPFLFALRVVFAFGGVSAQETTWQPSPEHTQMPISAAGAPWLTKYSFQKASN